MDVDLLNTSNDKKVIKRQELALQVVNLGLLVNSILAVAKIASGIFGHSKALLADGINSFSDVVYLIFVKILVKLSGKPADDEHPYGHHQLESIAGVVIGAFVIVTGILIFWDSINSFFDLIARREENVPVQFFTLLVALLTIATKLVLMFNALKVGKKTENIAVLALAKDHFNDIFSSVAASIGIILGLIGINWFDPFAGAIVAIFVVKTGVDILRESTSELMDTIPDKKMNNKISKLISSFPEVIKVECIHLHKFGPYFVANLTIAIDGELKVYEGDKIADKIESTLYNKIELLRRVYIHYHPAY